MNTVSVIVPVYNTGKYLSRCIESLLKQTLPDLKIILVDDCSTDNSREIIRKYARDNSNIKPVFLIKNFGVAHARNKGLSYCFSEFVGFCDSDDYVDPEYYAYLYNQAKNYDMVRGIRLVNEKHAKNEYGCLVPSIIRKSFLINNKLKFPDKKVGEDSTLKRWIYQHTDKILEVEDKGIYYHYIKRAGSLSNYDIKE